MKAWNYWHWESVRRSTTGSKMPTGYHWIWSASFLIHSLLTGSRVFSRRKSRRSTLLWPDFKVYLNKNFSFFYPLSLHSKKSQANDVHSQNQYAQWGRGFHLKVLVESFPSWVQFCEVRENCLLSHSAKVPSITVQTPTNFIPGRETLRFLSTSKWNLRPQRAY